MKGGNTMKLKQHSKLGLVLGFALAAQACTTFGHKKGGGDDDGLAKSQDAVVTQVARLDPVVSNHDRKYWLDLRGSKALVPRLQGALATGEAEAAVGLAKAWLAQHPGDVQGMTMLAAALAMSRKYDLAAYYASLVEKAQPGNGTALNIKGLAIMLSPNRKVADYRVAMEYFKQAYEADASQIAPALNLASLQLELGNAGGAAATFEAAAARCDRCNASLMGMGIAYSRARQFDKAKGAFQDVLAKNPNHAGALYNLALVHRNGYNDNKQAEKYLFALLNDSRTKNTDLKERAQTVLRRMKGEKTSDERMIADEDEPAPAAPTAEDEKDAELLMTGAELDDK